MRAYQPKSPECPQCGKPSAAPLRAAEQNEWGDDIHSCTYCGALFAANYETDGEKWEGWCTRLDFAQ